VCDSVSGLILSRSEGTGKYGERCGWPPGVGCLNGPAQVEAREDVDSEDEMGMRADLRVDALQDC
jgi:hypothetical protein